jgi:membrane protein
MHLAAYRGWLWEAGVCWQRDNVMRMSSSLAYYTLLSLAPLVMLVDSIAGLLVGDQYARNHMVEALTKRLGHEAGLVLEAIFESTGDTVESVTGAIIGLTMLVVGASGAFGELQAAMNTIWGVEPSPGRGFWGILRDRFVCCTMVGGTALIVLILLVAWALMSIVGKHVGSLPGGLLLWQIVDFGLSLVVVAALFALTYKMVPDVQITFREVWPGALLATLLFALGALALAQYLRLSRMPKPYGAVGAVMVLLVWVYYTGQIMFYGAEFTKTRAAARGVEVRTRKHARRRTGFAAAL